MDVKVPLFYCWVPERKALTRYNLSKQIIKNLKRYYGKIDILSLSTDTMSLDMEYKGFIYNICWRFDGEE